MSESSRQGKIARLPHEIREQVNRRLLDGQNGQVIIAWLNAHPAVQAVLKDQFDGKPVNGANLTHWRQGGFAVWQSHEKELEKLQQKVTFAINLTKANGGNLADGAAAIAAGHILDVLERCKDDLEPKELANLVTSVAQLRSGDIEVKKLSVLNTKLAQKDKEIAQAERKLKLLEEKAGEAKAKLTTITKKGGLTPEALRMIEEAAGLL